MRSNMPYSATPAAPRNRVDASMAQASMRERTPVRRHSLPRARMPAMPVGRAGPRTSRTPRAVPSRSLL
ncbi:hypothetical protein G6F60_015605 [Rhizopus arrhizus]|nr:hypothetical protein G6F60_015605 [Rhizopus arrhizus]